MPPPPPTWWLALDYVMFVIPAVAGAVLGWSLGVTGALLLPAVALHMALARRAAKARVDDSPPRRFVVAIKTVIVVSVVVAVVGLPHSVVPLVLVVAELAIVDPIERVAYRHYRLAALSGC